jgi:coproporphyrinogen III oxidase-like Fe-S oxidoreductase
MMEEVQTIFAVGAGAVSKLVDYQGPKANQTRIKRLSNPKYPYEYLKMAEDRKNGVYSKKPLLQEVVDFFAETEKE